MTVEGGSTLTFIRYILIALMLGSMSILGLGYFGFLHPALDSLGHFRFHVMLISVFTAVVLAFTDHRRFALVCLPLQIGALGVHLYPAYFDHTDPLPAGVAHYRFLQMNVRFNNPEPKDVLGTIAKLQPDIVSAQEVTDQWISEFATIKAAYPYQLRCKARGKVGGVVIVSRRPFVDHDANSCNEKAGLVLQAIDLNGSVMLAGSIHLFWPWPYKQADHIAGMAGAIEQARLSGLPVLLGGDFNAATWSHAVGVIADQLDGKIVRYSGSSWAPLEFPKWSAFELGLPLDNFISKDVTTGEVKKAGSAGSDHLPLLLEFSLPARTDAEADQMPS